MPRRVRLACWYGALILALTCRARGEETAGWTRFRGPNGQGIATAGAKPPVEFGPEINVGWRADVAKGVSSPIVTGDRIFLTAVEKNSLVTLCLNARDGKTIWRQAAPAGALENVHAFSSAAAATPVTDGQRV